MRVAYLNTPFRPNHTGGGHVHMAQFAANATALGHEIWAYPGSRLPEAHEIPAKRLGRIRTMRQMNVLYVRLESRFPRVCTWSLPPRRLLYGIQVVAWEFNTIPDEAKFRGASEADIRKVAESLRHYGRGCDLAVCVAQAAADYVRERLGIQRVLVVPNGSDPDLFDPSLQPVPRILPYRDRANAVWIGSGKLGYHDFDTLRETASILWARGEGDKLNFHIIGPDLAASMSDMPPSVYYWGAEGYRELPRWLAAMDIGLYVSRGGTSAFGSPLKVFDYMASGLAVVSTAHPAVADLFRQLGQPDLMVPPSDPQSLANVLSALASDRERVRRLGQAGRQLVIDRYNWRQAVQDTMAELEAILGERRRRGRR